MVMTDDTLTAMRKLVERLRAEGKRIDNFHATMGFGYAVAADELEALLSCLPQQETDTLSCPPGDQCEIVRCVHGVPADLECDRCWPRFAVEWRTSRTGTLERVLVERLPEAELPTCATCAVEIRALRISLQEHEAELAALKAGEDRSNLCLLYGQPGKRCYHVYCQPTEAPHA